MPLASYAQAPADAPRRQPSAQITDPQPTELLRRKRTELLTQWTAKPDATLSLEQMQQLWTRSAKVIFENSKGGDLRRILVERLSETVYLPISPEHFADVFGPVQGALNYAQAERAFTEIKGHVAVDAPDFEQRLKNLDIAWVRKILLALEAKPQLDQELLTEIAKVFRVPLSFEDYKKFYEKSLGNLGHAEAAYYYAQQRVSLKFIAPDWRPLKPFRKGEAPK